MKGFDKMHHPSNKMLTRTQGRTWSYDDSHEAGNHSALAPALIWNQATSSVPNTRPGPRCLSALQLCD